MALSHIRHNIQVKEEAFCFFSFKCCEWTQYISHECDCDPIEWHGNKIVPCTKPRPLRCSKHNTELKAWQLARKHKQKWKKLFEENYRRWRFVKMLTLTLPGSMHIKLRPGEDSEDYKIYLREEIRRRFKLLRKRSKYWKKVIDGGQWYFECPITDNITNPHLHILLVGPKLINQKELQKDLDKYNLGTIAKFSSPKNKDGVIQKMTYWKNRRLILNKSAVSRALNYVVDYMKKEDQVNGKNNSFFGKLHGNKR